MTIFNLYDFHTAASGLERHIFLFSYNVVAFSYEVVAFSNPPLRPRISFPTFSRLQCHLSRSWLGIPHRFADQSVAFDPPPDQTIPSFSPPLLAISTDVTSTDTPSSYISPTDPFQRDTAFPVHMRPDASSSARVPRSADKLSALPSITDLLAVLTEVVTPLNPDRWQSAVDCFRVHRGNIPFEQLEVDSIPTQIREGFDFGLRHLPREPLTPNNHISNDDDASCEAAAKELLRLLRDGRLAGPFDYDWLRLQVGSFRSNPLSVIGKRREPAQPSKHRVIENMSYPRAYDEITEIESCNDLLAANDFPCRWTTLAQLIRQLRALPPSMQCFCFDFADAFYQVPLLPSQRLHMTICWEGRIYIRRVPCFGGRTTPGVFGNLADVTQDFLELRFPSVTIFKQVDDVIVFCPDAALAPDKGFDWTRRFTCFPNACTKVWVLHNVRRELSEWKEFLGDANNLVYCFALKPPSIQVDASFDASDIALGIVINSRASVFPLPSNWEELRDAHITVVEAWAVERAHRTQFSSC
ncbi:BQ5605_C029g10638 [Microbotryum silenes-dioicae]|uniref:BQ5605_C029g10638 protein n=1 Tax=Microbotryum silenes-dioicae TaxID=796604 RepID=A0A2X0PJZ8_9BASI|nr:BQ5605_C029g10638 [Microbotryum silenes-dioicae]